MVVVVVVVVVVAAAAAAVVVVVVVIQLSLRGVAQKHMGRQIHVHVPG